LGDCSSGATKVGDGPLAKHPSRRPDAIAAIDDERLYVYGVLRDAMVGTALSNQPGHRLRIRDIKNQAVELFLKPVSACAASDP
jgi:hypothetical protein